MDNAAQGSKLVAGRQEPLDIGPLGHIGLDDLYSDTIRRQLGQNRLRAVRHFGTASGQHKLFRALSRQLLGNL